MENQTQRPLPNATAVLVLGIVSIVGCFCHGVPGLICGIIALVLAGKDMRLLNADPTMYTPGSVSNLRSGRICAIIGVSLSTAWVIFIIVWVSMWGWAFLSHPWMWQHSSM